MVRGDCVSSIADGEGGGLSEGMPIETQNI